MARGVAALARRTAWNWRPEAKSHRAHRDGGWRMAAPRARTCPRPLACRLGRRPRQPVSRVKSHACRSFTRRPRRALGTTNGNRADRSVARAARSALAWRSYAGEVNNGGTNNQKCLGCARRGGRRAPHTPRAARLTGFDQLSGTSLIVWFSKPPAAGETSAYVGMSARPHVLFDDISR